MLGTLPGRPTLPKKRAPPHPLLPGSTSVGWGGIGGGDRGRRQADPHVFYNIFVHASHATSPKRQGHTRRRDGRSRWSGFPSRRSLFDHGVVDIETRSWCGALGSRLLRIRCCRRRCEDWRQGEPKVILLWRHRMMISRRRCGRLLGTTRSSPLLHALRRRSDQIILDSEVPPRSCPALRRVRVRA